jgi:pyruvate dehydrogenase E2 component (dihydrolipoamide acetyltransferase)
VRKLIAKAMYTSLQNSAQLTHHLSADVRTLLEARQKIKNKLSTDKSQQDITLNDMVCWCVIKALGKFPEANSHFLDDRIKTFHKVHLGLAVDTPRGLMVPTVKNADDMDLNELSKELKSVAEACKKGSINPELIQSTSATFTVSNLGNYGVEMFTPVINLPQAAILGVCTIINRPANIGNNIFGFVPYIGLSLTYDHRAIDGGPATLFLKEIKEQIEAFRY